MTQMFMALTALVIVAGPAMAQSQSQAQAETPQGRAILVLDASGSMWGQINGENKIVIAREVVSELVGSWDAGVHLGLTAYGHRRKGDCSDIETLAPVGPVDAESIASLVNGINPKGKTPLSAAVQQAAEALKYTEEAATVILVTDGLETCEADPCAVATSLEESGVEFTTHVVGFDLTEEESTQVQCLAENTGGQYFTAGNASELREALGTVVQTVQRGADTDTIHVVLAEGGEPLEGVSIGFEYFRAEDAGKKDRKHVTYGYGAKGRPAVAPGNYVAAVKLGAAAAELPFEVLEEERRDHTVNLNAGRLTATARMDEESGQAEGNLGWEIHRIGDDGTVARKNTTYDYGDSPEFVLPAGRYRVSVKKGSARATADQVIEAGADHELAIDLRAGTLTFDAVLTEGGEPAEGNFGWEAFPVGADGKRSKKQATYSYGSDGSYTLAAGRYALKVKAGSIERWAEADVPAGETVPLRINLDGGYLNFDAVMAEGGEPAEGNFGWQAFPIRSDGSVAKRQIAYSYGSDGQYTLPAGDFALEVKADGIKRQAMVSVAAGETTEQRVVLDGARFSFMLVTEAGEQLDTRPGWQIRRIKADGSVETRQVSYGYASEGSVLLPEGAFELHVKGKGVEGAKRFEIEAGKPISIDVTVRPKS